MPKPLSRWLVTGAALAVLGTHAIAGQEAHSTTSSLVQTACSPDAPLEFRAFKERQIHRRQADLEKTLAALRADAIANANSYTAEDRKDFAATVEQLRAEQEEIRVFLARGCATDPLAVPASVKRSPVTFPVSAVAAAPSSEPSPPARTTPTPHAMTPSTLTSRLPDSPEASHVVVVAAPTSSTTVHQPTATASVHQEPTAPTTVSPTPPQLTSLPSVDVQALKKQVDDIQDALSKQPTDFGLVLGVGSLLINPNVSDYTNDSNVLHTTNLGSSTPQLLSGVTFRSHMPTITRRWRDHWEGKGTDRKLIKTTRCSEQINKDCLEPWQYHPWSGFVSLKFAPGASQLLNGYVIGGTYSITKHLDALVGFALTPINEASPGFRVAAAQFVANQQKLGLDLNFDPNAMLANRRNAFDGFPVTDANGKLIYQGSPTTVHYRGGVVVGVSFPLYFGASFKPTPNSNTNK